MEKFQSISSKVVIALALVWAALTFTKSIPTGLSYMIFGGIAAYIGIQNIILLNWGLKIGRMSTKITYQIEQHGHDRGIKNFVGFNILAYLILGIIVFVCGCMIQF